MFIGFNSPQTEGEKALKKLLQGNEHYVKEKLEHPHQTIEWMKNLTEEQHPFAIIIGCSDSRVPPEIIFDQGIGDLFIVRLAGNVVDDQVLGSIEYAVDHLDVPLIMVVGHEKCGAIEAAVNGKETPGHIDSLIKLLRPAVEQAKGLPGDMVENVARLNVKLTVDALSKSNPILAEKLKEDKLLIVGSYYHLDTGIIEILSIKGNQERKAG